MENSFESRFCFYFEHCLCFVSSIRDSFLIFIEKLLFSAWIWANHGKHYSFNLNFNCCENIKLRLYTFDQNDLKFLKS
jgi:hypothetical protein